MPFQLRTFDTILADLISYMVGSSGVLTDFNEGSITRTLGEAVAQEQARFYYAMLVGINDAIEQSAYTTFGFGRLAAQRAYGAVSFTRDATLEIDAAVTVPAGTIVSVGGDPNYQYETQSALTLSANAPVGSVIVLAAQPGAIYNVAAGAITTLTSSVSGVSAVTNPASFITGSDAESDLERRERFKQWLTGLHRATKSAIIFGAETATLLDENGYIVERVTTANTIEESPGLIWVYIHNGATTASVALQTQCQKIIAGYRDASGVHEGFKAAGIQCVVFAATLVPVDVSVAVEVEDGFLPSLVTASVAAACADYFAGLAIGDPVRIETLKQVVKRTPGVLDIATWDLPAASLTLLPSQIAVLGNLAVSAVDLAGNADIDLVLGE